MANQHTKGADKALTAQQEQFCEHFLKFGNATQAAIHAGYSHPDIQAIRLLSKPHIKQFLQRAIQARALGFATDLMDELANIALDRENVQAKDRIAAAVAVLDRANIPNGRQGPTINVDARSNTVNVTGDAVAKLINETYNRGRGGATMPALPAPDVELPEVEEGEYEPVNEAVDNEED